MYPDRDTFHFTEILAYLYTVALYFLAIDDKEQAEERLKIMKQIEPDDPRVKSLERELLAFQMKNMLERTKKSQELMISVESFPTVKFQASETFPELKNELLKAFYEYTPDELPEEIIEAVKQLDREILTSDLELIIIDSIKRFEWFRDNFEKYDESKLSFQVHALYWLGALEAKESLPIILDMLRQGEEFLDYWFSDQIFDFLLAPLYLLAERQLSVLKQFVLEPNVSYNARLLASQVVEQVAHHQKSRQKEVESWFEEVLQFHINHPDDKGIIDTSFITWTVSYMMNINAVRLIPLIEILWNKTWLDDFAIGTLEEIKEGIHKPHNPGDKEPMPQNIDEFYSGSYHERKEERVYSEKEKAEMQRIQEEMEDDDSLDILSELLGFKKIDRDYLEAANHFDEGEEFTDYEEYPYDHIPEPIKRGPKIGRNAPCPCGSGKKYKKCCLNKK